MHHRLLIGDASHDVWLIRRGQQQSLLYDGHEHRLDPPDSGAVIVVDGDIAYVHHDGRSHVIRYQDPLDLLAKGTDSAGDDVARAPMPGSVIAINVAPGDSVAAGDTMIVIESMKLETAIRAVRDGVVADVHFSPGAGFDRDAVLVTLTPRDE